jgi:predicted glycosyltransferase
VTGSVLFHVQHLLGIGHLQRALLITDALARRDVAVTLVSGGPPIAALAASAARRVVQLAPIRARDDSFALVDGGGRAIDDALRSARRDALLAAFAAAPPDAVIVEGFPLARRAFRFELDPLIAAARGARPRPLLLCSIRDILVARDDSRRDRDIVARVRRDFDAVLVHGDPTFIPLDASFPLAPELADRLVYTGYVAADTWNVGADGSPRPPFAEVLVSAGGGAVGYRLLMTALAARRGGCLAGRPWRLLAGTNLPAAEFAALSRDCPEGVTVERHRTDFPDLLRRAAVSVSQAGYNTVLDVLAAEVPAVLVPFATDRETEQRVRAERLARRGAVEHLAADELAPERLAAAIERAVARGPRPIALDTDGADRAAQIVIDMIARREEVVSPVSGDRICK